MKIDFRVRCVLFGCWCDENSSCPKCGAPLYDSDFVQIGKLDWIKRVNGWIKGISYLICRRCEVCGKRMRFSRDYTCSPKCNDEWFPF